MESLSNAAFALYRRAVRLAEGTVKPHIEAVDLAGPNSIDSMWSHDPLVPMYNSAPSIDDLAAMRHFFEANIWMIDKIRAFRIRDARKIPSLVVPKRPLILTRVGDEVSFVVPKLPCTKNAITAIFGLGPHPEDRHKIITSSSNIAEIMLRMSIFDRDTFDYSPFVISPEDYITMAGTGMLGKNETPKTRVDDLWGNK